MPREGGRYAKRVISDERGLLEVRAALAPWCEFRIVFISRLLANGESRDGSPVWN